MLALLVESANEYVPKRRIIEMAWSGVVVEEGNLPVQISAIRRVLAQAPGGERWVETLAKRGYRFVGPIGLVRQREPARESTRSLISLEANTSFVGRQRELRDITRALSRTRLLTLSGAGGIGKTRLALRFAAEAASSFPDGIHVVELATIADPGVVVEAVAMVFRVEEQSGESPLQKLIEHLNGRHLMLMLDNAEHLRASCAEFVDTVLLNCRNVVILVTSREPLGLAGESNYRVPSLSMPELKVDAAAQSLSSCESVQLFADRARLNLPHFAVTDQNASALASVCRRLDGIPLAIELAAARMRSMSLEEVDEHLDQRLRLLTGGSPTAPRRQQTMRALIDWSYDLLSQTEAALLCRLSVFAGGWTLEAAERVCADDGLEVWTVLDLLANLSAKSLVVAQEKNGDTRYGFLETVRQYAWRRLCECGAQAQWQDRHLTFFVTMAEEAEPQLSGADQKAWLDRLEAEHDNLRAALTFSSAPGGDVARGLRLAGALWRFWYVRGHLRAGLAWLRTLLATPESTNDLAIRAKALNGAGGLARQQGDYAAAQALYEESLAVWRGLGDRLGICNALGNLGGVASNRGDFASAKMLYDQSLAIRRQLGDRLGEAGTLGNLGIVAHHLGDIQSAEVLYGESLAIRRQLGDRHGIALALANMGALAESQGQTMSAKLLLEESLAIRRELGDRHGIATSQIELGKVAIQEGKYSVAMAMFQESLASLRDLGERRVMPFAQEGLASLAQATGGHERAACIWGTAERLREAIGSAIPPDERSRYDRNVAAARAAIGNDPIFNRAWQRGRAMTLEQAVAYSLEQHAV